MKANKDSNENASTVRSAANTESNSGKGTSAMPPPLQLQTDSPEYGNSWDGSNSPEAITGPGASVSVASGTAHISAPYVSIDAPMVKVNGILQSDTLITNSVIASSYTPGAGNMM